MLSTILFLFGLVIGGNPNAVEGTFWSPKKDGKIKFYSRGDHFFGKLVWSQEPEDLDEKNPDPEKRSRKTLGLDIFYDFTFNPDENEWNGHVYDPESGNTYKCNMWLTDGGKKLKVRGYLGFSWIGRTEEFERIN